MDVREAQKQLSELNGRNNTPYPIVSAPDVQRAIVNLIHFDRDNESQRNIEVTEVCWMKRDEGWLFRAKGIRGQQRLVAWGWADCFEDAVLLVGLLGTDPSWSWRRDKYAR